VPDRGDSASKHRSTDAASAPARSDVAALSKEQVRKAYEAAMAVALAITRSGARAEEVVQDAFERLLTTRRWDSSKGPLDRHMAGIVRSLLNIGFHAAAPKKEAQAQKSYQHEVIGVRSESAETLALSASEKAERSAHAEGELEQLRASVAAHPVAPGVLRCRAEGLHKAADIAAELNVSVDEVYRANELLRERLKKIRKGEPR
jgi:DNA-directed RNA polymerase specialized sigma24 family protein